MYGRFVAEAEVELLVGSDRAPERDPIDATGATATAATGARSIRRANELGGFCTDICNDGMPRVTAMQIPWPEVVVVG